MKTKYIGVDPGKVTGVAVYESYNPRSLLYSMFGPPLDMCNQIRHQIRSTAMTTDDVKIILAVERYTLGNSTRTQQPDALEIIGILRWLEYEYHGLVSLVIQGAADASKPGSRENLTKVGWWIKADPDQHRNKAAAQVALAMLTHDPAMWHGLLTGGTIKT